MRILHLDTLGLLRGGQGQILLLARGLEDRGHKTFIATPRGSPFFVELQKTGLSAVPIPPLVPFYVLALIRLIRNLRPHLIHAHDARGVLPAAAAARLARGPRVVASRRVEFPARRRTLRKLKYMLGADLIIATSHNIRNRLEQEGIPSSRLAVIRDGVDLKAFTSPGGAEHRRVRSGRDAGTVIIGTLGALSPEKGLRVLIDAVGLLKDKGQKVRLFLAGEGPQKEALATLIDAKGLSAQVTMLGKVAEAPAYLEQIDILVQPSLHEGLGTAVLEAMSVGLPVVASAVGGLPEAVDHGKTGMLVPPGDASRLCHAIMELSRDRHRSEIMGREGRARVVRLFASDRMVDETLKAYRSLLGERHEEPE